MEDVSVASHAHRKLRRLERYVAASELLERGETVTASLLSAYGSLVGYYQNDGNHRVVFTTNGILNEPESEWRFIPYAEIQRVVRDEESYGHKDVICLQLRTGSIAEITIEGMNFERGTHDKYEVMMFIDSVAGQSPSAPPQ